MRISRRFALIYDETMDSFGDETHFAHACVRALTQYTESLRDAQREEIQQKMSEYDAGEETEPDGANGIIIERDILLDHATFSWLSTMKKCWKECEYEGELFLTSVILLKVMKEIVAYKPSARLVVHTMSIPIQNIINVRPRSMN